MQLDDDWDASTPTLAALTKWTSCLSSRQPEVVGGIDFIDQPKRIQGWAQGPTLVMMRLLTSGGFRLPTLRSSVVLGVLPNHINVQIQMSVHDADSSFWCALAEETLDPFQNKAKINIQSIKEGKILPQHWKMRRSYSRDSTDGVSLCFCFHCASDSFFYHLAGESGGLLLLFHKFCPVNTEV